MSEPLLKALNRMRSHLLDPEGLVGDYGQTTLVPFSGEVTEGEEPPETVAFVREEQVKRLSAAERSLSMLGRVNPLSLE